VTGYWAKVAAWTGFCETRRIPYQNLADWYSYSSTVAGADVLSRYAASALAAPSGRHIHGPYAVDRIYSVEIGIRLRLLFYAEATAGASSAALAALACFSFS
jgi:hypothetical protein